MVKVKTRILIAGRANRHQSGFTYILVLIALVVVGILVEVAVIPESQRIQRQREQELLFRGLAYREAIRSYYEADRLSAQYPRRLEDLLLDNRVAHRRHIRKLYKDPVTGGDWQLIRNGQGGITGVVSAGRGVPLKQAGFPPGLESFEQAKHYSDWVFEYSSRRLSENP